NKRFEAAFGRTEPPSEPGQVKRRPEVAAVQSYQWHVLNKSESWLTEAVRAEYAGSYMIERPFQDAIGSLKMIAGTAYMIRADVLRQVGWGTSITEDWELTLKLYTRGYKVIYTPWAETPAECVSTFGRLTRQRMRWAEGHTHNVRKWFLPIMGSSFVTPIEKLEFLYDASYYLQAALFVVGSIAWLVSEVVFDTHVPGWTALLGWSLLFSNIFALPLMNLAGLILEEAPARDVQGVVGALVLSFALVPFQGWAAFKGLISKDEGPWFRTPKTGRVTDEVKHLRRLHLLRRWSCRHVVVQQPSRANGCRGGVDIHHVLDRWHREHQRHGLDRGRCFGDVQLRRFCGDRAGCRIHVDRDVWVEWHEHHESVHREHQRQPAADGHRAGRIAVHSGDPDAQHRGQAIDALRRNRRRGRHPSRAAEHRRP